MKQEVIPSVAAVNQLQDIISRLNTLHKLMSGRKSLTVSNRKKIVRLSKIVDAWFDIELDKELTAQKKSGKKFLSDEDIDKIINECR